MVGINTGAAGNVSGTATVGLASNGTVSGLSNLTLSDQVVSVSGNVIALANPVIANPINFGALAVSSPQVSQAVSIANVLNAPNASFQELLNAAFGTLTNISGIGTFGTNGGSITGLAPGATNNTSMVVTFTPGSTVGAIDGTVQIQMVSDGTGFGLGTTNLPNQTINLTGSVTGIIFNPAQGSTAPTTVNAGNIRINTAVSQALTIANTAPAGLLTEGLNANFGTNTGNVTNDGGTITGLAGGASNNTNMSVSLNTSAAGARSGTATVNFLTDGSISGNPPSGVGSQVINISGNVYRLATGDATPAPLNLGNFRLTAPTLTGNLNVTNTAANDGFSGPVGPSECDAVERPIYGHQQFGSDASERRGDGQTTPLGSVWAVD